MKDIYSMSNEDFREQGFKDGQACRGKDINAAFDKIASEVDIMAYFGMGIFKRTEYMDGFKAGFGA